MRYTTTGGELGGTELLGGSGASLVAELELESADATAYQSDTVEAGKRLFVESVLCCCFGVPSWSVAWVRKSENEH
jgi:hypothetical protein